LEPQPVSPTDVAACLRVLAGVAEDPTDPALADVVRAVDLAYRAGKKARKASRRDDRRDHDRALIATATRFHDEIPSPQPEPLALPSSPPALLRGARRCYVCKEPYRELDADYHLLCPLCAKENRERRDARCDLTGRRAVVTGGRVKIGFHTALKLLRDGAEVLVTTRFPDDAARRYERLPDAAQWRDQLWIHGVDFIDLPGVVGLVNTVRDRWGQLDILVNNAAQTIRRPPDYYRELRSAERKPTTVDSRELATLFPLGLRDETGEQLDLRATNSWTLRIGEVTPQEWLETHVVNAFVPFLLSGQLQPLLAASPHPDRYVVQVSAMEGSFSRPAKTERHPHTNMAKAGLNMLTRTVAGQYAADGIYMSSVDTGWVTDERPHPSKQAQREAGFRPPLDVIDGAARVYDPIVRGVAGDRSFGVFLKDYREVPW
jgi:NAD(P)-dependent dehydrogenase (short-subunit alcohol dehydrogenase family)